jgi:hypothetical protein
MVFTVNSVSICQFDRGLLPTIQALRDLPFSKFPVPGFMQADMDAEVSLRDFYLNRNDFRPAIDCLNCAIFACNPYDVLKYVHEALTLTDRAARVVAKGVIEPGGVMCFDDIFALFFGVFLASEIVDVARCSVDMNKMLVGMPLLSPFQYTQAMMEAIMVHLTREFTECQGTAT